MGDAMKSPSEVSCFTADEIVALNLTTDLWNAMRALPPQHPGDLHETARDIHNIQHRIMARVVARVRPDIFVVEGDKR